MVHNRNRQVFSFHISRFDRVFQHASTRESEMVSVMLRYSLVGKWTGGTVGAESGKLIEDYKVWGEKGLKPLMYRNFCGLVLRDWRNEPGSSEIVRRQHLWDPMGLSFKKDRLVQKRKHHSNERVLPRSSPLEASFISADPPTITYTRIPCSSFTS